MLPSLRKGMAIGLVGATPSAKWTWRWEKPIVSSAGRTGAQTGCRARTTIVACAEDGTVYTREGDLEGRHGTEPPHISELREWRPDIGILGRLFRVCTASTVARLGPYARSHSAVTRSLRRRRQVFTGVRDSLARSGAPK